jgi:cation-transporting ATPase 13A3/4/5
MSESVPTSVTSFAHHRARADSTASFTYLQPADDTQWGTTEGDEEALVDEEAIYHEDDYEGDLYEEDSADLEAGELSMRRMSSNYSRGSVHDRLLRRDSGISESYPYGRGKLSQRIYIVNEDLTIVVAGFRTSQVGYILYATICVITFGLAYLLFRWVPKWQVWLTGSPTPLRDCSWVVIEVRSR